MLRRDQIKILWTVIIILIIIQLASIFLFYQNNYGEVLTINNIEDVAEKATSSVVFIRADEKTGSGVIVASDGYIITNYHVVDDTDNITVRLHNKNIYVAENVGVDKSTDIAVLKINVDNLDFLELADSDNAKVGSEVVAIGNPFGLDFTVTSGIISAVHRDRGPTVYRDFIQTDASINPGNSGGPLLDLNSKVIGINTFIISEENAGELGFAIPSNLVKKIFLTLTNDGKVDRGYIGVIVEDLIKFDDKGNGVFIE